jgi:hypothetical protein
MAFLIAKLIPTSSDFEHSHKLDCRYFFLLETIRLLGPYVAATFAPNVVLLSGKPSGRLCVYNGVGLSAFRFSWSGSKTSPSIGAIVEIALRFVN